MRLHNYRRSLSRLLACLTACSLFAPFTSAQENFHDGYFEASRYDEGVGEFVSTLDGANGFVVEGVPSIGGSLGITASGAGDVNADGIDDLMIGAGGAVYVVFGAAAGHAPSFDLGSLDGTNGFSLTGEGLGWGVSEAGDLNADGIDDLAIGSLNGSVYVLFGSAAPFSATLSVAELDAGRGLTISTPGLGTRFSISGAADFNGDGIDDLAIGGAGRFEDDGTRSYVVFGSATRLPGALDVATLDGSNGMTIVGGPTGPSQQQSISGAGDVNGDGLADLLIGQPFAGDVGEGRAFVVYGSAEPLPATFDLGTLDGTGVRRLRLGRAAPGDVRPGDARRDERVCASRRHERLLRPGRLVGQRRRRRERRRVGRPARRGAGLRLERDAGVHRTIVCGAWLGR